MKAPYRIKRVDGAWVVIDTRHPSNSLKHYVEMYFDFDFDFDDVVYRNSPKRAALMTRNRLNSAAVLDAIGV